MSAYVRLAIFVTCIAILAGCSRERRDCSCIQRTDTIEAYGDFLAKHGDSPLAAQAETRVKQLGEERDWQQAATTIRRQAYQAYLRQHPAEQVGGGSARIRVNLAGRSHTGVGGSMAFVVWPRRRRLHRPHTYCPAHTGRATCDSVPRPATPSSRTFEHGIQLGAFSTEAKAHAEWERVARAHGSVLAVFLRRGGSQERGQYALSTARRNWRRGESRAASARHCVQRAGVCRSPARRK